MYEQEYKLSVLIISLLLLAVGAVGYHFAHLKSLKIDQVKASDVIKATPTPTPIPSDIVGYIEYKFGPKAIDALTVLQGQGMGTCAENRTLDPNEVNYNWTKTPGVWSSKDVGYWQFNNVHHPEVTEACAKDVKCSTDRAYQIYLQDGNFHQWSASKCYGLDK